MLGCSERILRVELATRIGTGTTDYCVILDDMECEAVIIASDVCSHIGIACGNTGLPIY
jgi:hypothetical protein